MREEKEGLYYEDRCLRTLPGRLLFGPAGSRLAVDILEKRPGFAGSIDFIHKMNITQLFTVCDSFGTDYGQADAIWYPTHMVMNCESEEIIFREIKTVIEEDAAVSSVSLENRSDRELVLTFECRPEGFATEEAVCGDSGTYACYAESPELRFGISVGIAAGWNQPGKQMSVGAGQKAELLLAACVGNLASDTRDSLQNKLSALFEEANAKEGPGTLLEGLVRRNRRFYEEAPAFRCDDKLLEACWDYRWYILKNSMCRPQYGNFRETVMYEGRDHRMTKDALRPKGWEFSKLIPLSTPLQVNDLRWHPDRELTKEIIRSAFAGQDEKGLLLCTYVETSRKSYANYMLWAIWLFYLLDGDKEFIRELVPKMKRYIRGHEEEYQDGRDSLLTERVHALTGKEYQPSYWYFHDFPQNPKDPEGFTPLKRVDRSVYHYLNLRGLAGLLRAVGDEDYAVYDRKADALQQDVNRKMWDEETKFYYDLHYLTDEKAMVRNIVGIYPFWAGMEDEERRDGILPLLDPEAFCTGSAFASVSKDCPAFSPAGGWMGNFIKGRNGCVWCGPSWPYTTGIALEALGNRSRKQGHCYDAAFDRYLKEYTLQHFRDGNRHKPYLVEHYNSVTGEPLSDEADYNHSFWLDIVITYVIGMIVREDRIEFDPLKTHLKWFEADNLMVRGHRIDVRYRSGIGLSVAVDGEEAAHEAEGKKILIQL